MRNWILFVAVVLSLASTGIGGQTVAKYSAKDIIALERGALDRWGKGDPQGYLQIMAPELTYFDPTLEKRLDGFAAVKALILPLTGKISASRFDMINPSVQFHGDIAVLTFNLHSYVKPADGKETIAARWNSSEIYRNFSGQWKIIHSHWSYIKPQITAKPE